MITLVGTSHEDLQGPHRLHIILSHYRPQVVGVEASDDRELEEEIRVKALAISQGYHSKLESISYKIRPEMGEWVRSNLKALREILNYEVRVAQQYATASETSVIYLGDRILRRKRIAFVESRYETGMQRMLEQIELEFSNEPLVTNFRSLSPPDLQAMLNQRVKNFIESGYGDYRRDFANVEAEDLLMEDLLWAKKVRESKSRDTLIMPIVGALHLTDYRGKRYSTLYHLLKDEGLNPKRIVLSDADIIEAGIPFVLE